MGGNLGLKETLNPTKRVSIGNIGNGAFDGSTPCINIGDSDSGFIGSADGVIDIYCNNAKVGYIDNAGLHMNTDVSTDRNIILRGDARRHIIIQNEDGSVRAYIYKDKGGDGIRINNGVDGTGDFVFNKNGEFYSPAALRAGGAAVATDGNVYGSIWGGWLNDWLNNIFASRFVRDVRAGNVESAQVWRAYGYNDQAPYVITGVMNGNTDDLIDNLTRRPLQKNINGIWYNIDFI
ncbi:phage tail protein [Salmonella enterica]|nr:phage tail protein [Salmonella enterica]